MPEQAASGARERELASWQEQVTSPEVVEGWAGL